MRETSGKRWPVIEYIIPFRILSGWRLDTLGKNIVLTPKGEHLFFALGHVALHYLWLYYDTIVFSSMFF